MKKVITYGSYDVFHLGHRRLLERAKALGDYLIVGVTSEDFDKSRGKINVLQSLAERIENVRKTGLADEIIIEEYEGQKIEDIIKYNVDVFAIGSDWLGKFNYLKEYCQVVYLDRTQGVSSTQLRAKSANFTLGLVGDENFISKYYHESKYVNGLTVTNIFTENETLLKECGETLCRNESYEELLGAVDAVYIASPANRHYGQIKRALCNKKHVLCESPIANTEAECRELFDLAKEQGVILMDSIKTAYATAFRRLLLLLKMGKIGQVVSVDATCTSQKENLDSPKTWNSISSWGPTAMLPIFQILGTEMKDVRIVSRMKEGTEHFDLFTKIDFLYDNAVAGLKVGKGVKSEGELVISGTDGYIVVPSPWWKTDYFEIKYENQEKNKRFFYLLEGEGIRSELVFFTHAIMQKNHRHMIDREVSVSICKMMEKFYLDKTIL